MVRSNTVLAIAGPCRRLRRNGDRARPTHGRPCRSRSPLVLGCSGLSCASTRPHPTLYHTRETVNAIDAPRQVGLSRGAKQHGGRKGRLSEMLASKRDCHGGHMADRPPPHNLLRNPVHLVNPVKKTPQSRPLAAHISVIHLLFIFVSRFLHPPRHQHEPAYSITTSKPRHYPVHRP